MRLAPWPQSRTGYSTNITSWSTLPFARRKPRSPTASCAQSAQGSALVRILFCWIKCISGAWQSIDNLSSSLLPENSGFRGLRAPLTALLPTEEREHAAVRPGLGFPALRFGYGAAVIRQVAPTAGFVQHHLYAAAIAYVSGPAGFRGDWWWEWHVCVRVVGMGGGSDPRVGRG